MCVCVICSYANMYLSMYTHVFFDLANQNDETRGEFQVNTVGHDFEVNVFK